MRKFIVKVNGNAYEVEVEETSSVASVQTKAAVTPPVQSAQVVSAPVSAAPEPAPEKVQNVPSGGTELKAPLPGTILKFSVQNGSQVKENDVVLIIEAMKMENEIRANASGVITFVAQQGASVNSGDLIAVIK